MLGHFKGREVNCDWFSEPGSGTCHDVRRHGAGSGSESVKKSMYCEGLNCVRQNEHLLTVRTVRCGLTAYVLWEIRDSCSLVF